LDVTSTYCTKEERKGVIIDRFKVLTIDLWCPDVKILCTKCREHQVPNVKGKVQMASRKTIEKNHALSDLQSKMSNGVQTPSDKAHQRKVIQNLINEISNENVS
jgi:hypothetical protein